MSLKVKLEKDSLMTEKKLTIHSSDWKEKQQDSAITATDIANENLKASQASIKDVDYASKMFKFISRPITH